MKQRKRIESYLDSLVDKSLPIEQQSLILSVDTNLIGGENKGCLNNGVLESCGNGNINTGCTNLGSSCAGAINIGCQNPPDNHCSMNSCTANVSEKSCGGA